MTGAWGCGSEAVVVVPPSGCVGAPPLGWAAFEVDVASVRWTGVGTAFGAVPDRCAVGRAAGAGAFVGVVFNGAPGRCAVDAVVVAPCTEGADGEPVAVPVGSVYWVVRAAGAGAFVGVVFNGAPGRCAVDAVVVAPCTEGADGEPVALPVGSVYWVGLGAGVGVMVVARCMEAPVGEPVEGAAGPEPRVRWVGVVPGLAAYVGVVLDVGWCGAGVVGACWVGVGCVSGVVRG
ncbi:hypothetical protein ABZZ74_29235 [Streptomyces sp. NPDC006476]|uniref:hypothetical protein n=1 Tax=Streptomyces sp. NPDC006476 TaxID=3157175 RepID=UPI0033AAA252